MITIFFSRILTTALATGSPLFLLVTTPLISYRVPLFSLDSFPIIFRDLFSSLLAVAVLSFQPGRDQGQQELRRHRQPHRRPPAGTTAGGADPRRTTGRRPRPGPGAAVAALHDSQLVPQLSPTGLP